MSLPNDPIILLSVINAYLRDRYSSLEKLCNDLGINQNELVAKLKSVDYEYVIETNQFK
ncbi:MAG: DUF4250 domain-containing protein [Clostridia bacterium]